MYFVYGKNQQIIWTFGFEEEKILSFRRTLSIAFCLFSLLVFFYFNSTLWIAIQDYVAHWHVNLALTFASYSRAGGYCLVIIIIAILQSPEVC